MKDRKVTCTINATMFIALAAIDEEIRYNQRMTQVFGGDEDLIDVGKAYANRAELWQALKDRLERLEKLHDYLEQPGVLMSIPQPVRLMISRLLHGET